MGRELQKMRWEVRARGWNGPALTILGTEPEVLGPSPPGSLRFGDYRAALPPQPSEPGAFAETPRLLGTRALPASSEWAGGPTCPAASGASLVRLSQLGTRAEVHLCLWGVWPNWGSGRRGGLSRKSGRGPAPNEGASLKKSTGRLSHSTYAVARTYPGVAVTRSPGE